MTRERMAVGPDAGAPLPIVEPGIPGEYVTTPGLNTVGPPLIGDGLTVIGVRCEIMEGARPSAVEICPP